MTFDQHCRGYRLFKPRNLLRVSLARWRYLFISKFQLAAAGHAVGKNSHTSFWNQAEDKFEQIEENNVQGLGDLSVTKEEVRC